MCIESLKKKKNVNIGLPVLNGQVLPQSFVEGRMCNEEMLLGMERCVLLIFYVYLDRRTLHPTPTPVHLRFGSRIGLVGTQ